MLHAWTSWKLNHFSFFFVNNHLLYTVFLLQLSVVPFIINPNPSISSVNVHVCGSNLRYSFVSFVRIVNSTIYIYLYLLFVVTSSKEIQDNEYRGKKQRKIMMKNNANIHTIPMRERSDKMVSQNIRTVIQLVHIIDRMRTFYILFGDFFIGTVGIIRIVYMYYNMLCMHTV